MNQLEPSRKSIRQAAWLPILLWIMPLLAINLGFAFFSHIDVYWQKHEMEVESRQEAEALASASDFSYQFAKLGGEFSSFFKGAIEAGVNDKNLSEHLKKRTEHIFRWPFPDYEVFTFKISPNGRTASIPFMRTGSIASRRVLTRTFQHLVHVNRGADLSTSSNKQNERMLSGLFGQQTKSDITGRSQRGKPTFVLYRSLPTWLLWDYFEIEGQGTFGYYILSHSNNDHETVGRILALRDLKSRSSGYGAFIPVFYSTGGIYQSPLDKSRIFRNWADKKIIREQSDLKEWLDSGIPQPEGLGAYKVFSHIGKNQTHLAAYVTPDIIPPEKPVWLFLANVFGGGLLILMIMRGLILKQWFEFNLRIRFIITYLLSATLPISLLIISSYGYVTQFRRSSNFQNLSSLQLSIKQFDTRKAQVEDEYRSAFSDIFRDQTLIEIMQKTGGISEEAKVRVLHHFKNKGNGLPLLCFAIMDEQGNSIRHYDGLSKTRADPTLDTFSYPIVLMLRNKIQKHQPGVDFPELKATTMQHTAAEAYFSLTGKKLVDEVDVLRSFPIKRLLGARTATQMHELIAIDGREKYAIMVVWDDQALDETTFKNSLDQIALQRKQQNFIGFRVSPQGLSYLVEPGRHIDQNFVAKAKELAKLAHFRGSSTSRHYKNMSMVAMPAKKYDRAIMVGGIDHISLNNSIELRLWVLMAILAISIAVVLICSYFSAKIILDPITSLKNALDRVAGGQLNTEIISNSQDELGTLCREFSAMTIGLRERKRFASLLSDQAMEAIKMSDSGPQRLANRSFSGVALVSDIRNFTGMCEAHSPILVTELLNEHFAVMAGIISEHGGQIYKFIGDAIEAVFPEDYSHSENAANRAFNAASLMLIRSRQINQARSRKKLFNYNIGIGLAYGQMHSGSVGSIDTRLDYAIIGAPLKLATSLEAMSVKNSAYPVVIDENLASALSGLGIKFSEIGKIDGNKGFSLEKPDSKPEECLPENGRISIAAGKNSDGSKNRQFIVGTGRSISPASGFIPGLLLIIAITLGVYGARHIKQQTYLDRMKVTIANDNQRLIEQMRSESATRIGFETRCRQFLSELESRLNHNQMLDDVQTRDFLKSRVGNSTVGKVFAERMAVYSVAEAKDSDQTYSGREVFMHGWSPDQSQILLNQALLARKMLDYSALKDSYPEVQSLNQETQKPFFISIFGDNLNAVSLHRRSISKAVEIKTDDFRGIFFWAPIVVGGHSKRHGVFSDFSNARIIGYIMAAVSEEKIYNSPEHMVKSFENESQKLALIGSDDKRAYSPGFPQQIKAKLNFIDSIDDTDDLVFANDYLQLDQKKFKLVIVTPLNNSKTSLSLVERILLLTALCVVLFFWWRTCLGETFINRSLTAKLWFALLLSSIIPVFTVYYVFDLFAEEDYSVSISKERNDLHRFIDQFELREAFCEPLAWKMVKTWTHSPQTLALAQAFNREFKATGTISEKSLNTLHNMFDSWHSEFAKLNQQIINFSLKDIVVAGDGWTFVNSGKGQHTPSEFGIMLRGSTRNIASKRIGKAGIKQGLDSEAVQGEIIVETGLQAVASLFGDDVYVMMANGLEIPILMHAIAGNAGLITHYAPDIRSPEYIVLWMLLFEYENYLSRMAKNHQGKYSIASNFMHRHGFLAGPWMANNRHELNLLGAWISSSGLPTSRRFKRGDENFIVEGRPGIVQFTSFLVAAASETPINDDVKQKRLIFQIALLLSFLLILIIARNAASDILTPLGRLIEGMKQASTENFSFRLDYVRTDELGNLCQSFDAMMRGLEEKALMGRMLSRSALNYSIHNQSDSRNDEFVFLYIGIPSFEAWASGPAVNELFADLKRHVAVISGIIISEGGDIDKIIGDKMLAAFPINNGIKSAVSSACRASTKIIQAEKIADLPFPVAIGINFGKVITGLLGVGDKRDFTVIGDAVNVTARIESFAENLREHRCLLSESVFAALEDKNTAREFGEVELKGKSLPMKVYQLLI